MRRNLPIWILIAVIIIGAIAYFFQDSIRQEYNWAMYKDNPIPVLSQSNLDPDFNTSYWTFIFLNQPTIYNQSVEYCSNSLGMPNCQNLLAFDQAWIKAYHLFNQMMSFTGYCTYDPDSRKLESNCTPYCGHTDWSPEDIVAYGIDMNNIFSGDAGIDGTDTCKAIFGNS